MIASVDIYKIKKRFIQDQFKPAIILFYLHVQIIHLNSGKNPKNAYDLHTKWLVHTCNKEIDQ